MMNQWVAEKRKRQKRSGKDLSEDQVKEDLQAMESLHFLVLNFILQRIHQGMCYECRCPGTIFTCIIILFGVRVWASI